MVRHIKSKCMQKVYLFNKYLVIPKKERKNLTSQSFFIESIRLDKIRYPGLS